MSDWFAGKSKGMGVRRGEKDRQQDHTTVPLTDLCGWTEQDLSHERSTCYCWCRRQGDFCPDCSLDYQPVKLCLFALLWVCYCVSMGSMCQNSAVVLGWMGGLHAQITHSLKKKKAKTSASAEVGECARFGKTTCEKLPKKGPSEVHSCRPFTAMESSWRFTGFLCTGIYQKLCTLTLKKSPRIILGANKFKHFL